MNRPCPVAADNFEVGFIYQRGHGGDEISRNRTGKRTLGRNSHLVTWS